MNDWGRKAVEPSVIPPETLTASGELWRDMVIVSSNDFSVAAQRLRTAADVDPVDPDLTVFSETFTACKAVKVSFFHRE